MNVEMHFSLKHFLHLATLFYVCGEFRSLMSTHAVKSLITPIFHQELKLASWLGQDPPPPTIQLPPFSYTTTYIH